MRKYIYILLLFLFCAGRTFAQFTLVSGTVTDSTGLAYACSTITASIVNNNGQSLYLNGVQFSPAPGATKLGCATDPSTSKTAGAFTLQLADNTQIKCGSGASIVTCASQTQWLFLINSPGIPPPLGTGPQTCTATLTISGTSQSVSSSFNACPLLNLTPGGGVNTLGQVFNVKTGFGAVGNAKESPNGNGQAPGLTCTDCNFTGVDAGKNIGCSTNGTSIVNGVTTTIASIVSTTAVTLSGGRDGNGPCTVRWGTPDDTPVAKAVTAWIAASNQQCTPGSAGGGSCVNPAPQIPPILYFPSGRYYLTTGLNLFPGLSPGGNSNAVKGDPGGASFSPSQLLFANQATSSGGGAGNALIDIAGGTVEMDDLLIDGMGGVATTSSGIALFLRTNVNVNRITVARFGNLIGIEATGNTIIGQFVSSQLNGSTGFVCNQCAGEIRFLSAGNSGGNNLIIQNSTGIGASEGFKLIGGLVDECGVSPCTLVNASHDVWFIGESLYGAPRCLGLINQSFVHWDGGICGPFGSDSNSQGAQIAAGSTLQSSDVRYVGSGTANCINNAGFFNDNGGNTCESQFPIASGTSVGNTATLTLTNVGAAVNANCSVGDALVVEGLGNTGYGGYYPAGAGGITAVTATTLSYTTAGANLGAIGAGGFAHCRNLQTYTGTFPRPLLNNPVPNTCYITGTFVATTTAAPMCNWRAGQATNITRITASSTTVTACTVAPVVSITDGTTTQTLTITTAKSQWDSTVDVSSGVGTSVFKVQTGTPPTGTITVTNTAGTCTTPPTNFSVSYNIAPILSN